MICNFFYSINEENDSAMYLYIFIFSYIVAFKKKKKVANPYHLPKKRGALKGTRISFLRDAFCRDLSQGL